MRLGGVPLVERAVRTLRRAGIRRVVVVVGYEAESVAACVQDQDVTIVHADAWADGNGASLAAAEHAVGAAPRFALLCGDHVFAEGAIEALLRSPRSAVLVDRAPDPEVWAEGTRVCIDDGLTLQFGKGLDEPAVDCGAFVLPSAVFAAGRRAGSSGDHSLSGALNVLAHETDIAAVALRDTDWWQDIDTPADLAMARTRIRRSLVKPTDGWISRGLNRPISTRLSMALAPLRLPPTLVSAVTFLVGVAAAWSLSAGRGLQGGVLTQVASILDGCDGETARLHGSASARGARLDAFFDRMVDGAIYAGLGLWAWGDPTRDNRVLVIAIAMLGFGLIAGAAERPLAVFEVPRRDEPRLVALLSGRDARMLILAIGAALGAPGPAIITGLATYGVGALWRVAFVAAGRRHWWRRTAAPTHEGGARIHRSTITAGRAARFLILVVVIVGAFAVVLPRLADLRQVWALISSLSARSQLLLATLALWNLLTYWPVVMISMPGLSLRRAALVCQSSTTVAMTVPGGGALAVGVSYAMFASWGFGPTAIASSTLGTFVVGMAIKLIMPAAALLILILNGDWVAGAASAALCGAVALGLGVGVAVVLIGNERAARVMGRRLERIVNRVRRWTARGPVLGLDSRVIGFREQLRDLLRDRWASLSLASLISQLSVFWVMLATMHHLGISDAEVSWAEALAVFASVRLATSVPIVPGNVGFAELGYIGGLLAVGGNATEVVAAVLLFRFLTFFVQIPIGAVTLLGWQVERTRTAARDAGSGSYPQPASGNDTRSLSPPEGGSTAKPGGGFPTSP